MRMCPAAVKGLTMHLVRRDRIKQRHAIMSWFSNWAHDEHTRLEMEIEDAVEAKDEAILGKDTAEARWGLDQIKMGLVWFINSSIKAAVDAWRDARTENIRDQLEEAAEIAKQAEEDDHDSAPRGRDLRRS